MLSLALLALAAASLCWPGSSGAGRLRTLGPVAVPLPLAGSRRSCRPHRWITRFTGPAALGGLVAVGVVAWAVAGTGVAIALAVATGTIALRWRARRRERGRLAFATDMANALRALVLELRAGAHPASAAEAAAAEAPGRAAAMLDVIARTARLGGDVGMAVARLETTDSRDAAGAAAWRMLAQPLARAWSLAERHGLPLADVLDSVRTDVAARVRFEHQVRARMAGPRASGTILSVLPVLGVLLGQGMGADPVRVLLATTIGHGLLALGTVLACCGVLWIGRLTSRVTS